MSSYNEEKVIRLKLKENESPYDFEEKFPKLFGLADVGKFEVAPTEEPFIDFLLFRDSDSLGEFGNSRVLTDDELKEYLPKFREIYPSVTKDDLRFVHFCWYNCTECEGYF